MNKNIIIGIIVVAVIVLAGIWLMQSNKSPESPAPLPTPSTRPSDTTGMILQDVEAVDLGDIDREFQDIDADLQTL